MTCLAVIDTNVLVSALLSSKDDAATVQVVGRMITGENPNFLRSKTSRYSFMITSLYNGTIRHFGAGKAG